MNDSIIPNSEDEVKDMTDAPYKPNYIGFIKKEFETKEKMKEIIETIMTMHWDMDACRCWVCDEGRELDCHPISKYLKTDKEMVTIAQTKVCERDLNGT